jgi:hypothetical protein
MVGGTGNGCFLINGTTAQSIVTRRANPTRYFFFFSPFNFCGGGFETPVTLLDLSGSCGASTAQEPNPPLFCCCCWSLTGENSIRTRVGSPENRGSEAFRFALQWFDTPSVLQYDTHASRSGPPWKAARSVCWHVASDGSIVPTAPLMHDRQIPLWRRRRLRRRPGPSPARSRRIASAQCPSAVRTSLSDVHSRGVASLGSCRLPLRHVPPKRRKRRHAKYTRLCNTPLIKLEYRIFFFKEIVID